MTETQWRTLTKVVTWRILLTASHMVNGWLATGSLVMGLKIAGVATIINSLLYWSHERLWNRWSWNRHQLEIRWLEGHPRTVSKLLTWRILITASNFVIPFIVTGSWGSAAIFLGLATVVNMMLYWSHERLWNLWFWQRR